MIDLWDFSQRNLIHRLLCSRKAAGNFIKPTFLPEKKEFFERPKPMQFTLLYSADGQDSIARKIIKKISSRFILQHK